MSDNTRDKRQLGFTIPELIVVLSVFGILSIAFLGIMTNLFGSVNKNNVSLNMTVQSQDFLRATVERIRYSSGVSSTNTLSNTGVGGTTGAGYWNTSNTNFVIVIRTPALDASTQSRIINSTTGDPYLNELVYYRDGNNLKLQVLAANTGTDGTNSQSSTCAVATPSCRADRVILEHLDSINFVFYDRNVDVTPTPDQAKSIYIDLVTKQNTVQGEVELNNAIRVTLRNDSE